MDKLIMVNFSDFKLKISLAVLSIFFILLIGSTMAFTYTYTKINMTITTNVWNITDGDEIYTPYPTLNIAIINTSAAGSSDGAGNASECGYIIDGGSNVTITGYLKNITTSNFTFTNSSAINLLSTNTNGVIFGKHNMTFYCIDVYTNTTWYNATPYSGWFTFYVNERVPQSVGFTPLYNSSFNYSLPLLPLPVNKTYAAKTLNDTYLSLNTTVTNCSFVVLRGGDIGVQSVVPMSSNFTNRSLFGNSTNMGTFNDTALNQVYNATFKCWDAFGNVSWKNSTFIPANVSTPLGFIFFKVDTLQPIANDSSSVIMNSTYNGNILEYHYSVIDNNTVSGSVQPILNYGTILPNMTSTLISAKNLTNNYTINFTLSDWAGDGRLVFRGIGYDIVGNENITLTNSSTYAITKIFASKWTPITLYANKTLAEIASMSPNITQVSKWDNGYKNFTTFIVGTSTNANTAVNDTNVTLIYSNADILLARQIKREYTDSVSNQTLIMNTSTTNTPWNLISNLVQRSMNATLYTCRTNNTEAEGNKLGGISPCYGMEVMNETVITHISYYNDSLGKFCSALRGYSTTSCYSEGFNVSTLTIPEGSAIWVRLNSTVVNVSGVINNIGINATGVRST